MKTISEALFERLCDGNSIRWEKIPTADEKTADYKILPSGIEIVAEVKQIDPNKEELEAEEKLTRGNPVEGSCIRGERVRKKILDSQPQLVSHSRRGIPTILVLYNNVCLPLHTEPKDIRAAMYGVEQHFFIEPRDPSIRPFFGGKRFGPKQRMTKQHNTSISALGVISSSPQRPELAIYHNIYARVPLPPEYFRPYGVNQFSFPEAVPGKYQEWVPV